MKNFTTILLAASIISIFLIKIRASSQTIQLVALLCIVATIVLFSRQQTDSKTRIVTTNIIFFLATLLTQLIVVATGGFLSPFLILFHLFILGISISTKIQNGIMFLCASLIVLILQTSSDQNLQILMKENAPVLILYALSFAVIIPLTTIVIRTYRAKEFLSELLTEHLQLNELREESILKGVNEMVIVTDENLNILSVNSTVEKALKKQDEELIHLPLIPTIPLKTEEGEPITQEIISLEKILQDKATRILHGLVIQITARHEPQSVVVQIKPIANRNGDIKQLVFVIMNALEERGQTKLQTLDQARIRHKAMAEEIKTMIKKSNIPELKTEINLYDKTEDDLFHAIELQEGPLQQNIALTNLKSLCKTSVEVKQDLAKSMGVELTLKETTMKDEKPLFPSKETKLYTENKKDDESFVIATDNRWVNLLLHKLIDIAILLTSEIGNTKVEVWPTNDKNGKVTIRISAPFREITETEKKELFEEYYGNLGIKSNLRFGSGLEGSLAKTIARQLDIPIYIESINNPPTISLITTFP